MVGVKRWIGVCENVRVGGVKAMPEGRSNEVLDEAGTALQHERTEIGNTLLAGDREDERRREATVGGGF